MIGWSPLESLESPQVKASDNEIASGKKPTSVPISSDVIELSNSVHLGIQLVNILAALNAKFQHFKPKFNKTSLFLWTSLKEGIGDEKRPKNKVKTR